MPSKFMSSTLKVDQIKENQNMEHKVYQLLSKTCCNQFFICQYLSRCFSHTRLDDILCLWNVRDNMMIDFKYFLPIIVKLWCMTIIFFWTISLFIDTKCNDILVDVHRITQLIKYVLYINYIFHENVHCYPQKIRYCCISLESSA